MIDKDEELKITHRIGLAINESVDAFHKQIQIVKTNKGVYQVSFMTVWKEGEEPVRTDINLTEEAMNLMQAASFNLMQNQAEYAIKDVATPHKTE